MTGSSDLTAKVWDASKSGRLMFEVRHQESVTSAAFSSDGKYLVTAGVDKAAIVWEIKNNNELSEALQVARVETRNYLDIALSQSRLVLMGQTHF